MVKECADKKSRRCQLQAISVVGDNDEAAGEGWRKINK